MRVSAGCLFGKCGSTVQQAEGWAVVVVVMKVAVGGGEVSDGGVGL